MSYFYGSFPFEANISPNQPQAEELDYIFYFVPSLRLSTNIFQYFMVTSSENTDFYILTLQLKGETVVSPQ